MDYRIFKEYISKNFKLKNEPNVPPKENWKSLTFFDYRDFCEYEKWIKKIEVNTKLIFLQNIKYFYTYGIWFSNNLELYYSNLKYPFALLYEWIIWRIYKYNQYEFMVAVLSFKFDESIKYVIVVIHDNQIYYEFLCDVILKKYNQLSIRYQFIDNIITLAYKDESVERNYLDIYINSNHILNEKYSKMTNSKKNVKIDVFGLLNHILKISGTVIEINRNRYTDITIKN